MRLRRIKEDTHKDLHIPSPVRCHLTLCGWVDVGYEEVESEEVTCSECCKVVREAHKIPLKALGE